MPANYSIRDLERLSGIKAHTLRIWEQRYSILQPSRTDSNIRVYGNSDLKRILNISLLNNNGFKISNIVKMGEKEMLTQVEKLLSQNSDAGHHVNSLVMCVVDLDLPAIKKIVGHAIDVYGIENTYEKIIFPFLRHLGNLWLVGIITPAQEHFISNFIRQKLVVAIDRIENVANPARKKFLFFLPENELHELGLLYAHYLAEKKGHLCYYLGQCVPLDDLVSVAGSTSPDYLVTILTSNMTEEDMSALFSTCESRLPDVKVLYSGRLFFEGEPVYKKPASSFSLFSDFNDFKSHL